MLSLPEMSHCEHERGVVFCELPCQRALFREQEKTVREILRGTTERFLSGYLPQSSTVLFLTRELN